MTVTPASAATSSSARAAILVKMEPKIEAELKAIGAEVKQRRTRGGKRRRKVSRRR